MKNTEKWLPITQKKAQSELTFIRQQIRTIDAFYSINHLPGLIELRRPLSDEIRAIRYYLKSERYKAILRKDLPVTQYRPQGKPKDAAFSGLEIVATIEKLTTPTEQRELLLVG